MMYSNKLVVAVRANGKILREQKDSVFVPFGSEYSLVIKNKNSLRALVRVEVDGQDATEGTSLIVPANGTVDLERFIKGGNLTSGNRFKFIERTAKIENGPRGVQAEDGLIRIEFEFEQEPLPVKAYPWNGTISTTYGGPFWNASPTYTYGTTRTASFSGSTDTVNAFNTSLSSSPLRSRGMAQSTSKTAAYSANSAEAGGGAGASLQSLNDVGITVPGSVSDQAFVQGAWFATDGVKHVMIMRMLGQVGDQRIEKPVTVKAKPTCVTCGTVNKATSKFCRECGTGLALV